MKSFKQFLLNENKQSIPPGFVPVDGSGKPKKQDIPILISPDIDEVKNGLYTTTAREALARRLGGLEKANEYIGAVRERRSKYPLSSTTILPSLEDADLDKKIEIKISPNVPEHLQKASGYFTPVGSYNKDTLITGVDWSSKENPVIINSNDFIRNNFPYNQNLKQVYSELTKGKIPKVEKEFTDVLWHEMQHVLQTSNMVGKKVNQTTNNAGGIDIEDLPKRGISKYVTSNMELAPHFAEAKSVFRSNTGINLGPNMTSEQFETFKQFLKNSQNKSHVLLYNMLVNPETKNNSEELLRQTAQIKKSSNQYYA